MSSVNESRARAARFVSAKVFVRGLTVDAEIGVYAHERGRRQPLIVDVELDVAPGGWRTIVETFAWRLARACLAEPCALRVRVRVEKPHALAPQAQAAGVEIIVERD